MMGTERRLRRQCRQLLRRLDVRPPLDVAELCHRTGELRGKHIRLVAHPIPVPGPFGVWISTKSVDYILYQEETSRLHQDHIILHELGHILAGHQSDEEDDTLLAELYPTMTPARLRAQYADIGPDAVRRALRRASFGNEQEREAETVATIILEWASVLDIAAPRPSQGAVRGMDTALGARVGWL
ncbi:hypothetical protein [Amycolatopsis magusensis]|uniref:hypothetical protein n=1 Tax=Amycolatopsis magusensis TaxID=882444 RepID=UPI0024A9570D|nr:hypothetical protein [Amycolatopsis magusensis]MDI5977987.1 hypothetical protein [Amycolatopsis magusensis]